MTGPVEPAGPVNAGLWEDFIDILFQPSAVFERRHDGKFGLALLALAVLSGVLFFALHNGIAPIMDAEMARQAQIIAAKNPQITVDQLAAQQGMMEKFANIGFVLFMPIGIAITAALMWVVAKFVDAKIAFAAAMMIATYSTVPRLIETVINALQGLLLSPESITSRHSVQIGPARFLDIGSANPVMVTLLGGLDLFTIWTIALLAIGVAVVAKVPISRAAIVAFLVWLFGLMPSLYQAVTQA